MKEHNGEVPQNARININYRGKKPVVCFKYPVDKKNTKTMGSMMSNVMTMWVVICLPGFIIISLTQDIQNSGTEVREPLSTLEKVYILVMIFGWMPIYFPFRKKWNSIYPDYRAWTTWKKYRKFTKNDLQERDGRIFIELPVFENVVCDFTATRDFNKYMEEFDITEHKFKWEKKRKCKITKKKKRFHNEVLFYAKWYFKESPKSGYMEVIFK